MKEFCLEICRKANVSNKAETTSKTVMEGAMLY